jgi:hypothetical protein
MTERHSKLPSFQFAVGPTVEAQGAFRQLFEGIIVPG